MCVLGGTSSRERVQQKIASWEGWPDDVRETLRQWNRERRLSFYRGAAFTCAGCERSIAPHPNGNCVFDGCIYCETCMVVIGRVTEDRAHLADRRVR